MKRFFDLKDETVEFLKLQKKMHWLDFFQARMDDCVPHNNDAAQEDFI